MHSPGAFDIAAKDMIASCKDFPSENIMIATYKATAVQLLGYHPR